MKYNIELLTLLFLLSFPAVAQTNFSIKNPPKVVKNTYGEMELKLIPFGLGNEIAIGKVKANGEIIFDWPEINVEVLDSNRVFMQEIKSAFLGMRSCSDDQIELQPGEGIEVVDAGYIYLYEGKRRVGVLFPAVDREILNNEPANLYARLTPGVSLVWFYSAGDGRFKADCEQKKEWEGKYDFTQTYKVDVQFKKGWNLVIKNLESIKRFKDDLGTGNLPEKTSIISISQIPENINWYIKR